VKGEEKGEETQMGAGGESACHSKNRATELSGTVKKRGRGQHGKKQRFVFKSYAFCCLEVAK